MLFARIDAEKKMEEIIKADIAISRNEVRREQALAVMKNRDEKYKIQLIEELPEGSVISLYTQGDYIDLCRGPHLPSTGKIKAFKLTSVTGAYWKGDQKNKMLQRIYGIAYPSKDEMNAYLQQQEEALKRRTDLSNNSYGCGVLFIFSNTYKLLSLLRGYAIELYRCFYVANPVLNLYPEASLEISNKLREHSVKLLADQAQMKSLLMSEIIINCYLLTLFENCSKILRSFFNFAYV